MRMIAPALLLLCIGMAGGCEKESKEQPRDDAARASAGTTSAPATAPDSGARATGGVNAP